ncbi:MAG: hypothetical protein ACLVL7_02745 [Anaerotruncus massiliensis (ex Togo et al. 2019)]
MSITVAVRAHEDPMSSPRASPLAKQISLLLIHPLAVITPVSCPPSSTSRPRSPRASVY